MDTREFNEIIAANSSWISALRTEVGKVVIGQQDVALAEETED